MAEPPHEHGAECRCYNCGFVVEALVEAQERIDLKQHLIDKLTLDNQRLLAKVRAFQNAEAEEQRVTPWIEEATRVFHYWRDNLHPKAKVFTEARTKAVVGMLKAGYRAEELFVAIDGAKVPGAAYINPRTGVPYNDLSLICRDEDHVLKFIQAAEKAKERAAASGNLSEESRASATKRERELAGYRQFMHEGIKERLGALRGWNTGVIDELELGLHGDRVVFPVRDAYGNLTGMVRYAPNPDHRKGPKSLAEGERELFPRPERYSGGTVWLFEGEPDAVAAASCGLQAVGVPGVQTWKKGWDDRLVRFEQVNICFDCDPAGREAANARQASLAERVTVKLIDLDPSREDGFDVSDVVKSEGPQNARDLLERRVAQAAAASSPIKREGIPYDRQQPLPRRRNGSGDPMDLLMRQLEDRGMRVRGKSAQCPAHDDRHASMSIGQGTDGRVLLTCHAGCTPEAILTALGLDWPDLFPEVG